MFFMKFEGKLKKFWGNANNILKFTGEFDVKHWWVRVPKVCVIKSQAFGAYMNYLIFLAGSTKNNNETRPRQE